MAVSFAIKVKEEISKKQFNICCQQALLTAFIKYNGKVIRKNNYDVTIEVYSNNNSVIRMVYSFLKNNYDLQIETLVIESKKIRKSRVFILKLKTNGQAILQDLDVYDFSQDKKIIAINKAKINQEHCIRAYIAGAFMACGSVNSPQTSNYHLELQFDEEESVQYFKQLLKKFDFKFNQILRKNKYLCYVKKSTYVSDFLKLIDASVSVLEFENVRISRDFTNSINRLNNIEISNQQKAFRAGQRYIDIIENLKNQNLFMLLNPRTQKVANLRLQYPDATLNELVYMLYEQYKIVTSKSGINHLFREIKKLYQDNMNV